MVQLEHNTVTWTQLSLLHFLPLVMGGEEVKNNIPRTLLQLLCNQQNCIKYIWSVVTVPLLLPKIELNKTRAFYFFLFFKKRTSHLVQCLIIQPCVPALPYSEARQTVWYWTTAAMSESEEQKLVYFIVQRPSLIHTHTPSIKPNLQSNTLPCTACCCYRAQQEGGRGLQLSDIMEMLVEDSQIPPPRWRWVSMKMRQLLSFQNCFFLLCYWGASQGQSLSLPLSAEEQKAYKLYHSNSYHLKFFSFSFLLKNKHRVAIQVQFSLCFFKSQCYSVTSPSLLTLYK